MRPLFTGCLRLGERHGGGASAETLPTGSPSETRRRQAGPDGWCWNLFEGYDTYTAVSRGVEVEGEKYVVQTLKRLPSKRDGWARYYFKLFEANGAVAFVSPLLNYQNASQTREFSSEKPVGFYVKATTMQEAMAAAELWGKVFYEATKMFSRVDACVPVDSSKAQADCAVEGACVCFNTITFPWDKKPETK